MRQHASHARRPGRRRKTLIIIHYSIFQFSFGISHDSGIYIRRPGRGKRSRDCYLVFPSPFGSSNLVAPVTDDWFKDSKTARFFNCEVKIPSVTDLIWSKVFIQNRERYDGADVAHLILLRHQEINWEPKMKVCRGRMFSVADYTLEVTELGFADVVGGENQRKAG